MLPFETAMRHAEALLNAGNSLSAIDYLRDALTEAPDLAYPHLLLGIALRDQNRLVGARHEVQLALEIEPQMAEAHRHLALILLLQQHRKQALAAARHAVELEPDTPESHLVLARILRINGSRARAEDSLKLALERDPSLPGSIAERGYAALDSGDIDMVEQTGRNLLEIAPGNSDGPILIGHARLAQGDHEEALKLALSALAQSPNDADALHLLVATKMKMNPIGGLWWRWNRFLVRLGPARAIYFVVGLWVTYRLAMVASTDFALPEMFSLALTAFYLGFVLYTLSAQAIVQNMVRKEIERVRFDPQF